MNANVAPFLLNLWKGRCLPKQFNGWWFFQHASVSFSTSSASDVFDAFVCGDLWGNGDISFLWARVQSSCFCYLSITVCGSLQSRFPRAVLQSFPAEMNLWAHVAVTAIPVVPFTLGMQHFSPGAIFGLSRPLMVEEVKVREWNLHSTCLWRGTTDLHKELLFPYFVSFLYFRSSSNMFTLFTTCCIV